MELNSCGSNFSNIQIFFTKYFFESFVSFLPFHQEKQGWSRVNIDKFFFLKIRHKNFKKEIE
jgi:hypothetical protein